MRRWLRFKSDAFNTTEAKDYFINPCCFGDDVARWARERLAAKGARVEEPGQEDFGWYLPFSVGGKAHCLIIAYQPWDPPAEGYWNICVERHRGCLLSVLGARLFGVSRDALAVVHGAFSKAPEVRDLSWCESSPDSAGAPTPY